ncbi:MAG: DMT family transporter [Agarilytica sp.]
MNAKQASIAMILAAALWGTHPVLIQLADWTALATAWIRGPSCALVLTLYILLNRKLSFKSPGLQLICGLALVLNSILFVSASSYTTPANAVLLIFTFPWITIALDYFMRGTLPVRADIMRLSLGLIGILIIVSDGLHKGGTIGDIFALLAGVSIALHITFSQSLKERHGGNKEVLTSMLFAWVVTSVVLLPFVFITPASSNPNLWYLALFGLLSAIPWLLWGKAVAYIPGHVVAALLSVEVFIAALGGWLVLGEALPLTTWVGGIMTLGAATLQITSGSKGTD